MIFSEITLHFSKANILYRPSSFWKCCILWESFCPMIFQVVWVARFNEICLRPSESRKQAAWCCKQQRQMLNQPIRCQDWAIKASWILKRTQAGGYSNVWQESPAPEGLVFWSMYTYESLKLLHVIDFGGYFNIVKMNDVTKSLNAKCSSGS